MSGAQMLRRWCCPAFNITFASHISGLRQEVSLFVTCASLDSIIIYFLDPESALASYEVYKKSMLSSGFFPMTPLTFMEKLQWLFTETEWKKRAITEDKLYFKIFYESDDHWRGVLYEQVENPEVIVVKEFEYVKHETVKKSNSFFGRLFN
jgi:hypothetical protein